MAKLAIEIGSANVMAAVADGAEALVVPLGEMENPFVCPSIGVKTPDGYLFGTPARLSALWQPDNTSFLSDYASHPAMVSEEMLLALMEFVKTRVHEVFNMRVDSISVVMPPYATGLHAASEMMKRCVERCGCSWQPALRPLLDMMAGMVSLMPGEKAVIVDLRNNPGSCSLAANSMGQTAMIHSVPVSVLTLSECRNRVEEMIVEEQGIKDENAGLSLETQWMRGETLSAFTGLGLEHLLAGKDFAFEFPEGHGRAELKGVGFQTWLLPKIEGLAREVKGLVKNGGAGLGEVRHMVLLGQIFRSDIVRKHLEENLAAEGMRPALRVCARPLDDWKPCLTAVRNNNTQNRYAL